MATYTGSDKRLGYLFQNGGGGGIAQCLYDATAISGISTKVNDIDSNVSSMLSAIAAANVGIAEIIDILGGGGGGGGHSYVRPYTIENVMVVNTYVTEVDE